MSSVASEDDRPQPERRPAAPRRALALPGLRRPARRPHRPRLDRAARSSSSTRPAASRSRRRRYPTTAWNVPWLHVAFENAAAVASGVESAQRALRRRHALPAGEEVAVVVFAGDGGTYDIGLQALSGALERGHRFLFVCYDNEAYMNTGVQRSGATPFAASTTTSPAGAESWGKAQQRKDMTAIAVAHHVPYVAQAAATHWHDLSLKVERAVAAPGPAFLNVLTDCPVGWGHEPRLFKQVIDTAVDCRFWPLYEVVDGDYRLTYEPENVPGRGVAPPPEALRAPPPAGERSRRRRDPGPGRGGLGGARRALRRPRPDRPTMPAVELAPEVRAMVESGRLAHLVTLNRDGSPQISCVWVGPDGGEIVSAHLLDQQKLRERPARPARLPVDRGD